MRQLAPAPPTMATSLMICGFGILSERWAAGLVPYPACTWTALRSLNPAVPGATSIRRASANPFPRRYSPGVCTTRRSHHSAPPHPAAVCLGCHRPPRDRGPYGKSTQPRPRSREASCRSARAQAQGTTPQRRAVCCEPICSISSAAPARRPQSISVADTLVRQISAKRSAAVQARGSAQAGKQDAAGSSAASPV